MGAVAMCRCLVLLFLLALVPIAEQVSCTKIGPCICTTSDGVIDLTKLANTDGSPKFLDIADPLTVYKYSWNPCYKFTEKSCTNVAVCQTSTFSVISIGTQDSAQFVDVNGQLAIQYSVDSLAMADVEIGDRDLSPLFLRNTFIKLVCDTGEGTLTFDIENPRYNYYLTLKSKYACVTKATPNASLSPGSVIVIIFFSIFALYIIGGVIFQVAVRKATGRERIPNVELWTGLPGLIKNGVLFISCRRRSSYEKL